MKKQFDIYKRERVFIKYEKSYDSVFGEVLLAHFQNPEPRIIDLRNKKV